MSSHGGGGGERWLVSYADFITLLMVLFVVLYAMGQTDIKRYKQLATSLKAAFSGGPVSVVDPGIDQGGGIKEDTAAAPIMIPGIPQAPITSDEVTNELTDLLTISKVGGSVSVQNNIEGVLISLSEKLLYPPGGAELQLDAYPVLETISKVLQQIPNDIRVVGYTDNTPPTDPKYATNWELSFARALVIANYLKDAGIKPERITISARGEANPLFLNDTPEHRAMNSRAEIIVIYNVSSDNLNLNLAQPGGQPLP